MILDSLDKRSLYKHSPRVFEALEALFSALTRDFPEGRLVVDGEKLYINPISLNTISKDTPLFEAHQRYIDIHCLFSGEERILIQNPDQLTLTNSYDEEGDYALYQGAAKVTVTLKPGDFLVCFPQDAHATGLCAQQPAAVRKLVAKILFEEEV